MVSPGRTIRSAEIRAFTRRPRRRERDDLRGAEVLGVDDLGAKGRVIGERDVLGAHTEHELGIGPSFAHFRQRKFDVADAHRTIARRHVTAKRDEAHRR